jgi:tetratricopeptide (TPR) repeat protein
MSESVLPPTAPSTLVIMLGASAWPNSPGFQASRAFVHAAQGFRNYLLDPRGFGLPAANLLDQFDAQFSSSDQLELLGSFLEQRMQALKTVNQAARDVLVYFVGHGGFAGPSADFYLLLRRTNASSLRASGMAIDALAEVLREKARQMRRYLFLDCCFAAAAFRAFQGGPDQTAITKTLDAFHVQARSSGFPKRGTVLLCSSDQKSPSLLLPDESCTMFSYALLDVLKNGDLHRSRQLSLRDIKELAEDRLAALPEKTAPRPGLHSPDQSEGDVADVPFFPNLRAAKVVLGSGAAQATRGSWLFEGLTLVEQGRSTEALAAFEQALALDPAYAQAHNGRGLALYHLRQYVEALVPLERALSLDPGDVSAWYGRGLVLEQLQHYTEALAAYKRMAQLDASLTAAWRKQGDVLFVLNRKEEALSAYEHALHLDSSDADASIGKGRVLKALGKGTDKQ